MNGNSILFRILLLFLIVAIFTFSCTADEESDTDSVNPEDESGSANRNYEYDETCDIGPVFEFDIESVPKTVPYPNNLYALSDGNSPTGLRIHIDGNTAYPMGKYASMGLMSSVVDAVNTMNGFSTMADLYVPAGFEPSRYSFPDSENPSLGESIFVMVDDPDDPRNGTATPIQARMVNGIIHLRPKYALNENSHYALVVTRKLRPKDALCYQASESMKDIWETYKNGRGKSEYSQRYSDTMKNLDSLGVDPADVLSVSEFTTQWNTRGMNGARKRIDQLAAQYPPQFTDWKYIESSDDAVQSYAIGKLEFPVFQNDEGHWVMDEEGLPILQGWQELGVYFSLPSAGYSSLEQPFPLIVYGHPLTEQKEGVAYFGLGKYFAKNGFAMAAIDSVCHGERTPGLGDRITATFCYFDFFNPLAFRDNIRESLADELWLVRALLNLDQMDIIPKGGDGTPDFDTRHFYYLGMSLNAIQGGTLTAVEEHIDAWVMNVAGAKWTGIALEGPFMGWMVSIAKWLDGIIPGQNMTEFVWITGGLYQHVLDSSDPANFLPHTINDPLPGMEHHTPHILQQGAESDFIVGGMSGAYYCRAGGWPQVKPFVWDVGFVDHPALPVTGSGFYQYDTSNHIALITPGRMRDAMRGQALHFMMTHYQENVPQIIDALAR